jgi:hypothetical protein
MAGPRFQVPLRRLRELRLFRPAVALLGEAAADHRGAHHEQAGRGDAGPPCLLASTALSTVNASAHTVMAVPAKIVMLPRPATLGARPPAIPHHQERGAHVADISVDIGPYLILAGVRPPL